jgi:hypothetical protein
MSAGQPGLVHYHMVTSNSLTNKTIVGTGLLTSLDKQTRDEPDTSVPGVGDVGGHADFTIREVVGQPGKASLDLDEVADVENQGLTVHFEIHYTGADAEFVSGNFSDLMQGKPVKIHLTEAGKSAVKQAKQQSLQQSFTQLSTSLTQLLPGGFTASPLVMDAFTATGESELTGNLTEMKDSSPDPNSGYHVQVHFSLCQGSCGAVNANTVTITEDVHDVQATYRSSTPAPSPSPSPNPTSGTIPSATLNSIAIYQVVPATLNCRSAPGTSSPIVQTLKQGQLLVTGIEKPNMPKVATASDGQPWLLVLPGTGSGTDECYVSANFQFITPQHF